MHFRVYRILFWSMWLTVASDAGLTVSDLRRLSTIVDKTLVCSDLPGLALSVVGSGKVLLERGYGVADLETGAPVTVDTLFPLGSATKAFTTSLMALLIDKHSNSPTRFNWSTPIRKLLGESFVLYDDQLTFQTTLEDVLSHRTGLPDYFLLLVSGYPYHVTRQQIVRSLRHYKPQYDFRSDYLYNNHMYVLAGHVTEVLENQPWEDLISSYLLKPIGMTSTMFVREALMTSRSKMAMSCSWVNGSCRYVDLQLLDQVNVAGPAGAIVSTARDMSRWLLWHLAGGRSGTISLIDKSNLWETYRERNLHFGRHMTARDDQRASSRLSSASASASEQDEATDRHVAYDLGWMTSYYRGARRVWHSGSISTYKTQVWLYPDEGYGLFVTVSGPNRPDTTTALIDLLHQISDMLLRVPAAIQKHPLLSSSLGPSLNVTSPSAVPSSAEICSQSTTSRESTTSVYKSTPNQDPFPVDPDALIGAYVSAEYFTGVTIQYDYVKTGRTHVGRHRDRSGLRLSIGRYLTAQLRHHVETNQFQAFVDGHLWWFADSLSGLPVRFSMSRDGSKVTAVQLPLDIRVVNGSLMHADWAYFTRVSSNSSRSIRCCRWMTMLLTSLVALTSYIYH